MTAFQAKPIKVNLTLSSPSDGTIRLKIQDEISGISFIEIAMNNEQLVDMLVRNRACTKTVSAEVRGLEFVGKIMEMKEFTFRMPDESTACMDKDIAEKNIALECPLGWVPDTGFNRQDSFFEREGKRFARTTIRRWV